MRVDIEVFMDEEIDGYEGTVFLSRNNVTDLSDLANHYTDATKAMGFNYVSNLAIEKDDGDMVWGDA